MARWTRSIQAKGTPTASLRTADSSYSHGSGPRTFLALQRDDAALATTCTALAPVNVKGIRESVKIFEVPWRLPGTISPIGDDYGSASSGHDTSSTGFIRLG